MSYHPIARKRRIGLGGLFAALFSSIFVTIIVAWFAIKIPAIIIFIVNIFQLVGYHNVHGNLDGFDFFWLILSGIGVLAL